MIDFVIIILALKYNILITSWLKMNIFSSNFRWIRIWGIKSLWFSIMKSNSCISLILLWFYSLLIILIVFIKWSLSYLSCIYFHTLTIVRILHIFSIEILAITNHCILLNWMCQLIFFINFLTLSSSFISSFPFKFMLDLRQTSPNINTDTTNACLVQLFRFSPLNK
jgi:hypothetical protein